MENICLVQTLHAVQQAVIQNKVPDMPSACLTLAETQEEDDSFKTQLVSLLKELPQIKENLNSALAEVVETSTCQKCYNPVNEGRQEQFEDKSKLLSGICIYVNCRTQ